MDEESIARKLAAVNVTQECIETLSLWVLHHKQYSDRIARVWIDCLRKANAKNRLALLYLCNDVLQRCRKDKPQFLHSFREVLAEAGPLLMLTDGGPAEAKIRRSIERVFSIWSERKVYDEAFIKAIREGRPPPPATSGTASHRKSDKASKRALVRSPSPPSPRTPSPPRPAPSPTDEIIDFEPTRLVEQVKKVRKLETDMNSKLNSLSTTKLDISKSDVLASCKDRRHCEQFEKDFEEGIRCLDGYLISVEMMLQERKEMAQLLSDAERYYAQHSTDVQLVTDAYHSFAARVHSVRDGLQKVRIPTPPPLPDECPSPTDSEIENLLSTPPRQPSPTPSAGQRRVSQIQTSQEDTSEISPVSDQAGISHHHSQPSLKERWDCLSSAATARSDNHSRTPPSRSDSPVTLTGPKEIDFKLGSQLDSAASFMDQSRDPQFLSRLKESFGKESRRLRDSRDSRASQESSSRDGSELGTPVRDEDHSSSAPGTPVASEPSRLPTLLTRKLSGASAVSGMNESSSNQNTTNTTVSPQITSPPLPPPPPPPPIPVGLLAVPPPPPPSLMDSDSTKPPLPTSTYDSSSAVTSAAAGQQDEIAEVDMEIDDDDIEEKNDDADKGNEHDSGSDKKAVTSVSSESSVSPIGTRAIASEDGGASSRAPSIATTEDDEDNSQQELTDLAARMTDSDGVSKTDRKDFYEPVVFGTKDVDLRIRPGAFMGGPVPFPPSLSSAVPVGSSLSQLVTGDVDERVRPRDFIPDSSIETTFSSPNVSRLSDRTQACGLATSFGPGMTNMTSGRIPFPPSNSVVASATVDSSRGSLGTASLSPLFREASTHSAGVPLLSGGQEFLPRPNAAIPEALSANITGTSMFTPSPPVLHVSSTSIVPNVSQPVNDVTVPGGVVSHISTSANVPNERRIDSDSHKEADLFSSQASLLSINEPPPVRHGPPERALLSDSSAAEEKLNCSSLSNIRLPTGINIDELLLKLAPTIREAEKLTAAATPPSSSGTREGLQSSNIEEGGTHERMEAFGLRPQPEFSEESQRNISQRETDERSSFIRGKLASHDVYEEDSDAYDPENNFVVMTPQVRYASSDSSESHHTLSPSPERAAGVARSSSSGVSQSITRSHTSTCSLPKSSIIDNTAFRMLDGTGDAKDVDLREFTSSSYLSDPRAQLLERDILANSAFLTDPRSKLVTADSTTSHTGSIGAVDNVEYLTDPRAKKGHEEQLLESSDLSPTASGTASPKSDPFDSRQSSPQATDHHSFSRKSTSSSSSGSKTHGSPHDDDSENWHSSTTASRYASGSPFSPCVPDPNVAASSPTDTYEVCNNANRAAAKPLEPNFRGTFQATAQPTQYIGPRNRFSTLFMAPGNVSSRFPQGLSFRPLAPRGPHFQSERNRVPFNHLNKRAVSPRCSNLGSFLRQPFPSKINSCRLPEAGTESSLTYDRTSPAFASTKQISNYHAPITGESSGRLNGHRTLLPLPDTPPIAGVARLRSPLPNGQGGNRDEHAGPKFRCEDSSGYRARHSATGNSGGRGFYRGFSGSIRGASRGGPRPHQAGRGWGESLNGEECVFGYQHDKIDYLSLPRKKPPVAKALRQPVSSLTVTGSPATEAVSKSSRAAAKASTPDATSGGTDSSSSTLEASPETGVEAQSKPPVSRGRARNRKVTSINAVKETQIAKKDKVDEKVSSDKDNNTNGDSDVNSTKEKTIDGIITGDSLELQQADTVPGIISGNAADSGLQEHVVTLEIGELECGGLEVDPMLATADDFLFTENYAEDYAVFCGADSTTFDTSSSFIIKDISDTELASAVSSDQNNSSLPLIEIGAAEVGDFWNGSASVLDIDDGYGGSSDPRTMANLLAEEPSVPGPTTAACTTTSASTTSNSRGGSAKVGLRGGAVPASVGTRRSSCRDRGAFDDFF